MLIDKLFNSITGNSQKIKPEVTKCILEDVRREIPQIRQQKRDEEERRRLEEELKKTEEIKKQERKKIDNRNQNSSGPKIEFMLSFPKKETFQELLIEKIQEKNITNVEFYKAAGIDRKLFSTIKNNKNYQPKKDTAIACCLGLKLSVDEADILLRAAGYALSYSLDWDCVIHYCLEHNIWNIDAVNEILYEVTQKCIRF